MSAHEQLLDAMASGRADDAARLVRSGIDLNAACDDGASVLYPAILLGDLSLIQLMLEHGADPNLAAKEPAASIYTDTPLDLAMQARFLIDWDKFHPVVELLERFGATDAEGRVDSDGDLAVREQRAREWQLRKSGR